jgi:hypothetical protein
VDPFGQVTGNALGTTTIKATDANNCTSRATVEVVPPCARFTISPDAPDVLLNQNLQFSAANPPPKSTISWSSDNPGILAIDPATGLATAGSTEGSTLITATAGACIATTFATVVAPPCTLGVTPASPMIGAGGGTVTLTATNPSGPVSWSSSNSAVATVNPASGNSTTVTGGNTGVATITADDGTCTKTSTVRVVGCTLSISPVGPITLPKASTQNLTANGANGSVTWSSSTDSWVSVVPASGLSTTAEAILKDKTVIITATDSVPAGCSATMTIHTVAP